MEINGILGGARRFGRMSSSSNKVNKSTSKTTSSTTFEGAALQDDFYQRDVAAEYEDLDFDAKEQFDDDDVDVTGDDNLQFTETSNVDRSEDEDEEEDDDSNSSLPQVGNGLASAAGLKAMMAKARGDTDESQTNPAIATIDSKGKKTTAYNRTDEPPTKPEDTPTNTNTPTNSLQQVMDAASKAATKAEKNPEDTTTGVERDENGQRLITLQAIRREIWLHHGQIRMKRLMKIFTIKKNDPGRYNTFRDLVKELCTMKVDKVEGNMLVLKQHWSNMG